MTRLLLCAAAGFLSALPQPRPEPNVVGASAIVESRDVPTLIVRFTNLSEVGLHTLEVEVEADGGLIRRTWGARAAPLGTGGTGEMAVGPLGSERVLPVRAVMAIFADGTVAGDPAEVARVQAVSIAIADDLSAWRGVLTQLTEMPQQEAVRVLRVAIEERMTAHANDSSGVRRMVELWIREARAPGFFSAVAKSELKNIDTRLGGIGPVADAARGPSGGRPRKDLSSLVNAVTTTGVARHVAVSVSNHRDVPLESWAVVVSDAKTGRPLRAMARDAGIEPATGATVVGVPARGLLEVGTYQLEADVAGAVRAHLEFAMWQDLTWQGYDVNQQRTLANRERRAEEYEFFLPAIRAAAALPPGQALDLLTSRQGEFSIGPLGRQSSGLQDQLAEWGRLVATSPQSLPERLNAYAVTLDRARAVLLRHRQ